MSIVDEDIIKRTESLHPPVIVWCENFEELKAAEECTYVYYSKFPDERTFPCFLYGTAHEVSDGSANGFAPIYEYSLQTITCAYKGGYDLHLLKKDFEYFKEAWKLTECKGDIRKILPEYFV